MTALPLRLDLLGGRARPVLALAHPDDPVAGDRDRGVLDHVDGVHGVAAAGPGAGGCGELVDVGDEEVGVHGGNLQPGADGD